MYACSIDIYVVTFSFNCVYIDPFQQSGYFTGCVDFSLIIPPQVSS